MALASELWVYQNIPQHYCVAATREKYSPETIVIVCDLQNPCMVP